MTSFLEVKNVAKSYDKKPALKDVNFKIEKPGVYLIAGPNGSGKTTLLESMVGLRQIDRGEIYVNGSKNAKELNKHIGFLLQGSSLRKNLTVKEEIGLVKDIFNLDIDDMEYLKTFNLEQYYMTKTQKLSGGTKRRILLALLFMPNYQDLILDEPASGLDTQSRSIIWNTIKKYSKEKVIIVSDHYLNQAAKYSDYIYLMGSGTIIAEGTKEDILKDIDKTHVLNIPSEEYQTTQHQLSKIDENLISIDFDGITYVFMKLHKDKKINSVWDVVPNPNVILDFHAIDFEDIYFYLTGNLTIYDKGGVQ